MAEKDWRAESSWKGKRVAVLGGGVSGQSAARLAARLGAKPYVIDALALPADARQALPEGTEVWTADFQKPFGGPMAEMDLAVLSPGVPRAKPAIAALLQAGVPLVGEIELAWRALPPHSVIAVTGTDGKSTVTSLLGHVLDRLSRRIFLGGNLGKPFADLAVDVLEGRPLPEISVLELSSFQLESIDSFAPTVAVILNVAADHLDRYPSINDYAAAKGRIFSAMPAGSTVVLSAEDSFTEMYRQQAEQRGIRVVEFQESQCGDFHSPNLPGRHNRANIAAVLAVLTALDVFKEDQRPTVLDAIATFPGLPHRLQFVGETSGIRFYDDSKATTVHAAAAALKSFSAPIYYIGGGFEGGEDFSPLPRTAADLRHVFAVGANRDKLVAAFSGHAPVTRCERLGEALALAYAMAKPGSVILFSPASKSFDRYKNYRERGEHFQRLVQYFGVTKP